MTLSRNVENNCIGSQFSPFPIANSLSKLTQLIFRDDDCSSQVTMTRRKTTTKVRQPDSDSGSDSGSEDWEFPKRPRFGIGKFVLGFLLLLVIAVIVLPMIIGATPLKSSVLNWATSDIKGQVQVDSLSLAWWSPVTAKGVKLLDEDGNQLAFVSEVKTNKSLFGLATSKSLGSVQVTSPQLNLHMRPDGTNIEDVFYDYINAPATGEPLTEVEVVWTNATANITAQGHADQWLLEESQGRAVISHSETPLKIVASGRLGNQQYQPQPVEVTAALAGNSHTISFSDGAAVITGAQTDISIATPVFERLETPAAMRGLLSGTAELSWQNWGEVITVASEQAHLEQFSVHSDEYLGPDTLYLSRATLSGKFEMLPTGYRAEQLVAQTDVGHASMNGLVSLDDLWNSISRIQLPGDAFQIQGQLDVAKLARMMPNTLRLQEGVSLDEANMSFQIENLRDDTVQRLTADIQTPQLVASQGGRTIRWDQPVSINVLARQSARGLKIERLNADSEFLKIVGSGTEAEGQFEINGDLQKLNQQLSQIFDLGAEFAGQLNGRAGWDRTSAQSLYDPFTAYGNFKITGPQVRFGETAWQQPELNLGLSSDLQIDQENQISIANSQIEVLAGTDQLTARLLQPVMSVSADSAFPLDIQMKGNVDTWLAQLSPFADLSEIRGTGEIDLTALAQVSSQSLAVRELNATLIGVDLDAYGVRIREQRIEATGDAMVDVAQGHLLIDQATLASSTVSASGQSIRFQPGATDGAMQGDLAFRVDLNRLSQWIPELDQSEIKWFGEAVGNTQLSYDGQQISGTIEGYVNDLVAASVQRASSGDTYSQASNQNGWKVHWQEPRVDIGSRLAIAADLSRLTIDQFTLDSETLKLNAAGRIADFTGEMKVNLQGNWQPDLSKVNQLVAAYAGDQVQISGGQAQAFKVQGPVFELNADDNAWVARRLNAETEIAWQNLNIAGLELGPSVATAKLLNSVAKVDSSQVNVSGGQIHLAPAIHLKGSYPTIVLPEGTIANQVELTKESCRGWLKFVAPLVADATSSNGKFSLTTDGIRLPLENVMSSKGNARLVIHEAQIGAGPLAQQLISLANTVKSVTSGANASHVGNQNQSWVIMPEQQVPIEINAGRVNHQGMTFQVGDIQIQTSGSVGLDQTMNLVCQIPIQDQWIGQNQYLASLKGQSIQIPMTGTLTQPKLDSQVVKSLTTQLLQQTAQGAIQTELNGLIQKEGGKLLGDLLGPQNNSPQGNNAQPGGNGLLPNPNDLINQGINRGLNELFGPKK